MIRRIAKVVSIVLVSLLLIFLAANSWDEDLRPEVVALLAQKPETTDQGLRAFYYSLGLRSGELKDPEAKGRSVWEAGEALSAESRNKFFDAEIKVPEGVWPYAPFPARKKGTSVADYYKMVRKDHADFAIDNDLSGHYLKLMSFKAYSAPSSGIQYTRADTPVQVLLKGHRYLVFHLGALAEQKLYEKFERVIREENEFYQNLLGHNHLLGVMITNLILSENADILLAEKKKNPNLKFKPETLASFKLPSDKEMQTKALNNEFKFIAYMLKDVTDGSLLTMFSDPQTESLTSLDQLKSKFFIKHNATLNLYYAALENELANPCTKDCPFDRPFWLRENPLTMIRNPGGKWVTGLMMTNLGERLNKLPGQSKALQEMVEQLAN